MVATNYERFEATNKDVCDIDKKFGMEFDMLQALMEKVAEAKRTWSWQLSVVRGKPIVRRRRRFTRRRLHWTTAGVAHCNGHWRMVVRDE